VLKLLPDQTQITFKARSVSLEELIAIFKDQQQPVLLIFEIAEVLRIV